MSAVGIMSELKLRPPKSEKQVPRCARNDNLGGEAAHAEQAGAANLFALRVAWG